MLNECSRHCTPVTVYNVPRMRLVLSVERLDLRYALYRVPSCLHYHIARVLHVYLKLHPFPVISSVNYTQLKNTSPSVGQSDQLVSITISINLLWCFTVFYNIIIKMIIVGIVTMKTRVLLL